MSQKLVVTDQAFGNTRHEQAAAALVGAQFSEHQCRSEDETLEAVRGAHAVINNFAPMTHRVMAAMAPGAVVVRYGVGVDNVDLAAARELGIRVCNVPDYGVEEVADHAAAMTLALARKLDHYGTGIRNGEWKIAQMVDGVRSLRDTTVGLIGLGRIARAFASRMAAFGCTIVGYDPYVTNQQAREAGIEPMSRAEVIACAHVLSLHVPLTPETRHVIDADAIARMPRGAILINCSRGGLIDETALAQALVSGQLSGAGLDVFEKEPLPADSPLRSAPHLLVSPHAAFFSDASVDALQRLASEEALRGLRGEALRCALT
ncbi:C-terminal binding protein [Pseudomonas tolaasii]|uniref:C-terminal binding protein n=2 Tax=Pseudomonas tolaasii TaxID=29442 RepID=A0A7Y8ALP4_PSETO|nr:C-terminal binding protein [Pseudomonas tolaasii]ARB28257.1 dihydrofolate reductase [Pseudomonas tolaasii]KAB0476991.1 C-terminal binding protein [Pseudomonas tolaasii]MBW4792459.1 C-terminal binding protein [Pseudomonas tolaasii]MBY8938698.1 C-terminal binding protein [Pseudomonas tolaasii]NWC21059.1 C-terminal binding protein [Pseudomonas tolaasii]